MTPKFHFFVNTDCLLSMIHTFDIHFDDVCNPLKTKLETEIRLSHVWNISSYLTGNKLPYPLQNYFMLFRKTIGVDHETRTQQTDALCGCNAEFLGAFAELRKATISFVMSSSSSSLASQPGVGLSFLNNSPPLFSPSEAHHEVS
jgi:hypothetical protein